MKKAISIILIAVMLSTMAGCQEAPAPVSSDIAVNSSDMTSSEETSSTTPVSSEETSSETPSSKETSSMTSSEKSTSVTPTKRKYDEYGNPIYTEEEIRELAIREEAEQAECRRLCGFKTEYTAIFEQEVYPIGTEYICYWINNKGPGCLSESASYAIDRFNGVEWVNVVSPTLPQTVGIVPMKPNSDWKSGYYIKNLTEQGRYRVHQKFGHGGIEEEKLLEFTLE